VANTKSAEKAARQADKHRARNVTLRSEVRSAIRKVNEAIASGKKDVALASLREATSKVDALVNKNIVHRNKASRHKSRLTAKVKALA
jgi:small subunit ribosomal protein S20